MDASTLSEVELEDTSRMFKEFDKDESGKLSTRECYKLIKAIGWMEGHNMTEVFSWFQKTDLETDSDHQYTLEEFQKVYLGRPVEERKEARLRRFFRKMDTDESGKLTKDEVTKGLDMVGYKIGADDRNKLMEVFGETEEGVEIEDFIKKFKTSEFF